VCSVAFHEEHLSWLGRAPSAADVKGFGKFQTSGIS
jgi:hypothetical protein